MPDGSHVLIADDETMIRLALQKCLQRNGFQVTTARNGLEALQCWQQHRADAVITDLRMPHLPGHELAARLRQADPELPIIVMSGYLSAEVEQFLWDKVAGPLIILMKPIEIDELLQRLCSMLTSEAVIPKP